MTTRPGLDNKFYSFQYDESIKRDYAPQEEGHPIPYEQQLSSNYYKANSLSFINQEKTKLLLSRNQCDTTPRFSTDITMLSQRLKTNMTLATYSLMFDLSQSSRPSDVYVYEQIKCQTVPCKTTVIPRAASWEEEEESREVKDEIKLSANYDDDLFVIDSNLEKDLDDLLLRFTYNNDKQQQQANTLVLDNELSCHC